MSMTETRLLYGAHVHANGIRQHYLRYGGKWSPLVLVPGITSPAITWGFVGECLAATHDVYILMCAGAGCLQPARILITISIVMPMM